MVPFFVFLTPLLFVLKNSFFVYGILDPIDFLALQAIRKSLDDLPGSNYFASWDFTSEPCNFAGVYCDGDKVIALNLGDPRAGSPGLTGTLDPSIGKLSSLAEFTVVPGRITGALPESLSQLKNLRFLGVSRNFLSGDIPASLGQLRELQTLDLSFNQLTGNIPWAIGALPALSNVILCHNHLSGSIPPFVSQRLTRLDLKHNELSGTLLPMSLPSSLEYLSLSWNQFTGPVDFLLTRLNQLNYLDLSLNRFTGCIPGILFTFPLTNLQLQRNLFTGPILPMSQVTIPTVDISFNRFFGEISPLFSNVQNLYLNNNRFTGQVPAVLVDRLLSAGMQVLYVQHNFLTGIEINPTVEIPVSSSLCLQYNCMIPPVQTACPLKAGKQKSRPTDQCVEWKGQKGDKTNNITG
ncbi:PREDICTED: LRR receptor-like serine/threonine-protein kinase ERL1 [Nicotiana attenuata]|uniref:LRR receptor-like serine/threonine-protein kinase ERL1 n=1 Tax=Nicotiana attenuata TaxID=49451 RepID=UPI0009045F4D|nr:PREDICTED: LRR receptor-like serine/threonine-protein kinase ERL1 [Nicotiana attenuata]